MKKRWKLITGLLLVTLTITGVALIPAALADEESTLEPPEPGKLCTNFLEKLASNLNVSVDQLTSAIKATGLEMVDEAVASGNLTDEQAALIKERIETSDGVCGLLGPKFFKLAPRPCIGPIGILDKAVEKEIITQEQADAVKATLQDIREYVRENGGLLGLHLDAAVTQGIISQAQADEIKAAFQDIKGYVQENPGDLGLRGNCIRPFGRCGR